MRKSKIVFVILSLLLTAALIVGCTNEEKSGYSLELNPNTSAAYYDADTGAYTFTEGEVDWTVFSFFVYDDQGSVINQVKVTDSMISAEDKAKVSTPGTTTVTVTYQGAKLYITVRVLPKVEEVYYTVTYNAGQGEFTGAGLTPETDEEGNSILKVTYRDGVVNVLEQPVRAGYDFVGWYVSDNYTGAKVVAPYTVTRDTTFYAKWSDQRKYSLQYLSYLETVYDGQVRKTDGIEHGTVTELIQAPVKTGYDFMGYYVLAAGEQFDPETTTFISADAEDKTLTIESDTVVRLYYTVKIVRLTFVSEHWHGGEEIFDGKFTEYKQNVAIYDGKYISGGCYVAEVPYNTTLTTDVEPIPVFPGVESSTGYWVDISTGVAPVYGKATKDMVVWALYEVKTFTMSFYSDENFEVPVTDTNGRPITRTAEYGQTVDSVPVVPERKGYTGVWVTLASDGHLYPTDLDSLILKSDVKVCAQYTPINYDIKFSFYTSVSGGSEVVETYVYPYGTVIQDAIDLSEYYNPKYYEIEWYSNRSLDTNLVEFPWTVSGAVTFYAKAIESDYRVQFIMIDNGEIVFSQERYVAPGGFVVPPEIIFDSSSPYAGQEVIGWRTRTDDYYVYDESATYALNDIVYYRGSFYLCIKAGATDVTPGTDPTVWNSGISGAWAEYLFANIGSEGIQINDFHEYNSDVLLDKAFYPIVQPKQYSVTFMNMTIKGTEESGYINEFVRVGDIYSYEHGTNYIVDTVAQIESVLSEPYYPDDPDGLTSDFIFDGWYTDPEFATVKVDFGNGYYFSKDTVFYARWIDRLKGTDGLEYSPVYADDGETVVSYTVTGFRSAAAEFSYIDLRIPETYEGKPVKAIAPYAFNDISKIIYVTTISLPANLETIGDNAFAALSGIEEFELSSNQNFVFEGGVLYSGDRKIIYRMAPGYEGQDSFVLPDSVETIRGGAFAGCVDLTQFAAGTDSVLGSIGDYAFDGCENLVIVSLPSSLTEIGEYAFRGCYKLSSITGGEGLKIVGYSAFDDVIGALNVSADGKYVSVGTVLVKFLGNDAALVLDDSFTAIAAGAFSDCADLVSFAVNSTSALQYIGEKAFEGAFALSAVRLETAHYIDAATDAFDGIALSCTLSVRSELIENYKADEAYNSVFGDSIIAA